MVHARHGTWAASARAARTRALTCPSPATTWAAPRPRTALHHGNSRRSLSAHGRLGLGERAVGRTARSRTRPAPGHRIPHRPTTRLPHDRPRARRILISVIWLSRRGRRDGKGIAAGGTTAMLDDANDRRGAYGDENGHTIIVGGRARGGRGSLRRIRRLGKAARTESKCRRPGFDIFNVRWAT